MSGGGDDPYSLDHWSGPVNLSDRRSLKQWDNPNVYATIPEFGVKPSEVNGKGFGDPVYGHASEAEIPFEDKLIFLIRTARKMAQKKFKTLKELDAARPKFSLTNTSYTSKQSVAMLYREVMWTLSVVSHPHTEPARRVESMASAAQALLMWAGGQEKEAAKLLSKRNSGNASMPRPNAKSPLRTAVINAMGKEKKGCQDFKTFMDMWRRAHIDGLTIKEATGNSRTYIITDENGDLGEQSYTWGSLEAMYSQA